MLPVLCLQSQNAHNIVMRTKWFEAKKVKIQILLLPAVQSWTDCSIFSELSFLFYKMDLITSAMPGYDEGLEHNYSLAKVLIVILNKERATILLKPNYFISIEVFMH